MRSERGQAALLGVVGVIVLAIGMYTSYNLGRAVYEKIELQNAADATAYSLANLEARTFNFIAFANRAQVANYVQMMEAQSLLSSATYTEGAAGWGGDLALTLGRLLSQPSLISAGQAAERAHQGYAQIVDNMDRFVPQYIRLMTTKNLALFGVSAMLAIATTSQLVLGAPEIVNGNDPDARQPPISYVLNAANVASFLAAFDFAALRPGGDSDDAKRARRIMAELANAARYGSGSPSFIASRGRFEQLGEVTGAMNGDLGGRARLFRPAINGARSLLSLGFVGTTKMLTEQGDRVADVDDTGRRGRDRSLLALGDAIAAKDQPTLAPWGNFASVVSGKKGQHCRYEKPRAYGSPNPFRLIGLIAGNDFKCDDRAHNDKHIWRSLLGRGGIQPYLNFAAGRDGVSLEENSFNQPDVWVWLNKPPSGMALANDRDLDFTLRNHGAEASFDGRIGTDGLLGTGMAPGMNVVARAQVYYHRPGAWHEPPNFFNPFWGARLAPKGVAFDAAGRGLGLPGQVVSFISDNLWMH
jgi:hypothetical protein